jgi:hypothetical protein
MCVNVTVIDELFAMGMNDTERAIMLPPLAASKRPISRNVSPLACDELTKSLKPTDTEL